MMRLDPWLSVHAPAASRCCCGCHPKSQYFVGKTPVTYAQLRAAAGAAARQLNVFYDAKGRTITRLVVSGQQGAPVRQPHSEVSERSSPG